MDFRDILGKFNQEPKVIATEEVVVTPETKLPSLKKIFEELSVKETAPAGMKPMAILDPANKEAGVGVISSSNPAIQKMLGGLDPKDVKIVMTMTKQAAPAAQPTQTKPTTGGATAQPATAATAMKEEMVDEKWAGNAKVEPTGQYAGKTIEQLKSMRAKLKASGPHAEGSKEAKRMKQINFAIRAKKGWKGGVDEAQLDEKAKNPYAIGMAQAMKSTGDKPPLKKSTIVKAHDIAKSIKDKTNEGDIASTKSQDTMGAGLGAGRSDKTLENKQVNESMNAKIKAAYHEGYSHGLRGATHSGKRYEDMEEARQYHEGYKMGLDECYGMSGDPKMGDREAPIVGLVGEESPASVPAMADAAMEGEMDEGNAFTAALAKTPKGGKFSVGGKTFTDKSNYDSKIEEFAFESLDKQLNDLLNEGAEPVSEGLSVSMSTGNEGSPDSVSVTGTEDEAGKLLAFIKQVGLGGMGADKEVMTPGEPAVVATVSDYGGPRGGHDDMAALMKKVGADDHHDHKHEGACNECGMMETECGCNKEAVEEEQTEDQKLYATTESDDSEDDGFDASARNTELDNAGKPASGGATNEDGAEAPGSDPVGQSEEEESEEVNEETTEKMDQNAEKAAEKVKKDIEHDDKEDREHDKLDEWANNAGQKGTDTAFEQDIEFMTKVISGGLNKPKVTGQTTIPVIAGQDARDGTPEDLASWMKLAGVKK